MSESLPLACPGFAAMVAPFLDAGHLEIGPVHVVDVLGMGCDGISAQVLLGLAFVVQAPLRGHVGVDLSTLRDSIGAVPEQPVGLPWPEDGTAWMNAVSACGLVGTASEDAPFVIEAGLILPRRMWTYQDLVQERLQELASTEPSQPLDTGLLRAGLSRLFPGVDASDLQRWGALTAVTRRLAVISGGPGTGKTFTVKKILALLYDQWQQQQGRPPVVALAAPTGKAAMRMRQAILAHLDDPNLLDVSDDVRTWLSAQQPSTLHRLLGYQPASPTRTRHHRGLPLPAEVVVVDETSMVDLGMMARLLDAIGPGARLIMLGDRNQLASVDAGTVLADITGHPSASRVSDSQLEFLAGILEESPSEVVTDEAASPLADAIVRFDKPYRSREGSGVHALAWAIAGGRDQDALSWLRGEAVDGKGPFPDLLTLEPDQAGTMDPDALQQVVQSFCGPGSYLERLRNGPRPGESREDFYCDVLSRFDQSRLLTPHRRGALGVSGLNRLLIAEMVERGAIGGPGAGRFWSGRPVMVTRNDYEYGLMNGDIGICIDHSGAQGQRRVVFPGKHVGEVRWFTPAQLPPHETVFAMTIHKSQGSEFETVFLVLDRDPSPLYTRELVYTALTRAKERIVFCGSAEVLGQALARRIQRASGLAGLLWSDGDLSAM